MDEGHCGLPTAELVPLAEKLLEVPVNLVRTAIDLEVADGTVIADTMGHIPSGPASGGAYHRRTVAAARQRHAALARD